MIYPNGHTVAEERAREQAEEAARMDVQVKVEDDGPDQASMGENRVLEFDDTSEFVQAIQYKPVVVKEESSAATLPPTAADSKNFTPVRTRTDSPMETDEVVHELEAGEVTVKEEEDDDDDEEAMLNAIEAAINTAEAEMVNKEAGAEPEVSAIIWCFYDNVG